MSRRSAVSCFGQMKTGGPRVIRLEKRAQPSQTWTLAAPVVAVVLTMIVGGMLFAALGKDPLVTIRTIFYDPLFSEFAWFYRPQMLVKGAPLVLIAIGLSFGFRAGVWNIGAEGQYIVGALCGAAVGLAFYPMESFAIFPLMVLAGAMGGISRLAQSVAISVGRACRVVRGGGACGAGLD